MTQKAIRYEFMTESTLTEMYSAVEAEVQIPGDSTTLLRKDFICRLKIADRVQLCTRYCGSFPLIYCLILLCAVQLVVCGQALSHCVKCTVEDIMKHWHSDMRNIYVLKDGDFSFSSVFILSQ